MPYITFDRRMIYSKKLTELGDLLRENGASEGDLNYVITRLLKDSLDLTGQPRYGKINTALGVLEAVKQELYRRVAAPYEDTKIKENSDVY